MRLLVWNIAPKDILKWRNGWACGLQSSRLCSKSVRRMRWGSRKLWNNCGEMNGYALSTCTCMNIYENAEMIKVRKSGVGSANSHIISCATISLSTCHWDFYAIPCLCDCGIASLCSFRELLCTFHCRPLYSWIVCSIIELQWLHRGFKSISSKAKTRARVWKQQHNEDHVSPISTGNLNPPRPSIQSRWAPSHLSSWYYTIETKIN